MKVCIVMSGCSGDCFPTNIFKTKELTNKWIDENKNKLYKPYVVDFNVFGKTKNIKPWQGQEE